MAKKKAVEKDDLDIDYGLVQEEITDEVIQSAKTYIKNVGDGKVGKDLYYMLKSRYRILYIRTPEELRVIKFFTDLSKIDGSIVNIWDVSRGLVDANTKVQRADVDQPVHESPLTLMSHIVWETQERKRKGGKETQIYLLLDFHHFLGGENGDARIERKIKEFDQISSYTTVVIISPVFICPPTLEKEITLVDFPFPSKYELKQLLDKNKNRIKDTFPEAVNVIKNAEKIEDDLIDSVCGLTLAEADNAFSKTLVATKSFHIPTIIEEKRQMIKKSGVLEYCVSKHDISSVGGLDTLVDWLIQRKLAFSPDARSFNLPIPRGILLTGCPGCGKSLICNALQSLYNMPLLRLDFGSLFNKYVGESEGNLRRALAVATSVSPCILWLDEVEKGISGSESSGSTDGGTTNRIFGTLLTWMSEKEHPVFIVATANNVLSIPPEFMRAGRFDEIFFLDLPDEDQRADVTKKLITKKHRDPNTINIDDVVSVSENYTPAEIEKGIDNALFLAYQDGKRELRTEDIVNQIRSFSPLYNSRREDIDRIRHWAVGKDGKGGRAVKVCCRKNGEKEATSLSAEMQEAALDMDNLLI